MKRTKWLALLIVTAGLLGIPCVTHAAATFKQISKFTTNSIAIQWDDMTSRVSTRSLPATVSAYYVLLYDTNGKLLGRSDKLAAKTRKYTIKSNGGFSGNPFPALAPGRVYKVKLAFYYKNKKMTSPKLVSLTKDGFFTTPGSTIITAYNHSTDQKGLRVRWDPVDTDYPVRYHYQIKAYNGKSLKKGTVGNNNIKASAFKYYNCACRIRVRAYYTDDNKNNYFGAWSAYSNIIPQPVMTNGQCQSTSKYKVGVQSDGTLILEWKRVLGAKEYKVYVSTSKNDEYKLAGTVNAVSGREYLATVVKKFNNNPFAKDRYYYVRVIAVTEKLGESAQNYSVRMALKTTE